MINPVGRSPIHYKVNNKTTPVINLPVLGQDTVSFTSLLRNGKDDFGKPIDSFFFRDLRTLETAIDEITYTFPEGATILDYACSDGEEAISIYSMLHDKEKYKIIGADISKDSLSLAKKGVYSIFSGLGDNFLTTGEMDGSKTAKKLKKQFYNIMEPTKKPRKPLSNSSSYEELKANTPNFQEKFFRIKGEHKKNFKFIKADVFDIDKLNTKNEKISAIFFRNALYHLTDNDPQKGTPLSESGEMVLNKIVDKVYAKLDKNGIFVLGNCVNDAIYIAPAGTGEDDCYKLYDRESVKEGRFPHGSVNVLSVSPLEKALLKDGRFKNVGVALTNYRGNKIIIPTVWKKVG